MSSIKCAQCGMVTSSASASCKQCGAALNNFNGNEPARLSSNNTSYPRARFANELKKGEIVKPCIHCGKQLALKRWDSWNGFLVQCSHCGGLHGKRWNIRQVMLASFFFNAFSFLFTMRPRNALIALSGYIVFAVLGNYLLDNEMVPDILEVVGAAVFILAPMIINAIVLIKHQRDLDNSSPPTQSLRT